MRIPRKITIAASATVAAVLAAGGIAVATPTSPGLPGATTTGEFDRMPADGPEAGWMGDMHGGDVGWMGEMHADGWMDGGRDAMHDQMGAMHDDVEQMARHHARMIERDPQMQQRHDEMVDRYPEMQEHMGAVEPLRGQGR
jgi:hypothetical protein